ncbi:M48 family metallopeptidase [Kiritimatiellaeota bacterium B1221]|nr:M48 family metallopeptidase [Kiritimatiellaeota bacterium B1221]
MNPYLITILALLIGFSLFHIWIHALNLSALQPEIPDEFKGVYDPEKYAKSQTYLRENTRVDIFTHLLKTGVLISFILLGGFNLLYKTAAGITSALIWQGLIFAGLLMLVNTIWGLPFQLYDTFVIEEKYGFNKTTAKTFVMDQIKGLLLGVLIGAPLFAALIFFFDAAGRNAWWISWLVVTLLQLVLLYIAPVFILPLFNKFEPLEEGSLRSALEDYAQAQGFQLSGLFKIDGSKRSTRANAYFTGFGKNRRIALYDTLIDNHSEEELVAILAHEVGHAKCKHIHKQLAIGILSTGFLFWMLSFFIREPDLYRAFGLSGESPLPLYAGLIFFSFLYTPISAVLGILTSILSRKFEYEADAYAVKTTRGSEALISGLKKLSVDNLSNLTPHAWLVFLEYSHPPVLQRIHAMRKVDPV